MTVCINSLSMKIKIEKITFNGVFGSGYTQDIINRYNDKEFEDTALFSDLFAHINGAMTVSRHYTTINVSVGLNGTDRIIMHTNNNFVPKDTLLYV